MIAVRIPHAAPVHCLADHATLIPDGILVQATVRADSPGVVDGVVRPGWLIEVAAQACAAAGEAETSATVRSGRLVSVTDWQWHSAVLVGHDMLVQVVRGAALGALREYRCRLSRDGRCVAEGTLVVMGQ